MKTQTNPKVTQTNPKKAGLQIRTGIKAGPGDPTCPDCGRSR